jgi:hypothetical protein
MQKNSKKMSWRSLGRGSLTFYLCPKCSSFFHTQTNGFIWTVRPLSSLWYLSLYSSQYLTVLDLILTDIADPF